MLDASAGLGFAYCFETSLGWSSIAWLDEHLVSFVFGHASARQAAKNSTGTEVASPPRWIAAITKRITRFTSGTRDDFHDVPLSLGHLAPFSLRVVEACRAIAIGHTRSYAELAAAAGSPRASRAAGGVMRTNRFPLLVPCHRVVASNGTLGGYSAPEGLSMKRRLLALEQQMLGR